LVQKKLKEGPARVTFCPTLACTTPHVPVHRLLAVFDSFN
jgi:hypothetical protein